MAFITFVTTCRGRLAHLRETLPSLVAQPTRLCGPLKAKLVYTLPKAARGRLSQPQRRRQRDPESTAATPPRAVSGVVPNEAILYRTHVFNPMIRREIDRLRTEVVDCGHWVVGYLKDDAAVPETPERNYRMYRRADLAALPYPRKIASVDWIKSDGNNDLPVLSFL